MIPKHETRVERAKRIAIEAHGSQKYGDRPYAEHLSAVAALCEPYGVHAVVLAWLHDTLEDTDLLPWTIEDSLGIYTLHGVLALTDPPGASRAIRKARLHSRLAHLPESLDDVLVVKAADRLANLTKSKEDGNVGLLSMYRREHAGFVDAISRTHNPPIVKAVARFFDEVA